MLQHNGTNAGPLLSLGGAAAAVCLCHGFLKDRAEDLCLSRMAPEDAHRLLALRHWRATLKAEARLAWLHTGLLGPELRQSPAYFSPALETQIAQAALAGPQVHHHDILWIEHNVPGQGPNWEQVPAELSHLSIAPMLGVPAHLAEKLHLSERQTINYSLAGHMFRCAVHVLNSESRYITVPLPTLQQLLALGVGVNLHD